MPSTVAPRNADRARLNEASLNPRTVADYVLTMSAELGAMAGRADLPLLRYLLEMVSLEAEAYLRSDEPRPTGG